MEAFANIISFISGFLYSYILIALLIAAGLYFTIKTGFIQFRLFGESIRVIAEKREDRESISSFQALMVSTASRVGTGNVVGVTGAIIAGGAGAVFWMWLIAIIGSASAFIESTLAQIYKKKGEHGSYGGPAYYIKQGLGSPLLGGAFAVALILTYMGGFNALASFNMTDFIKVYVPGERSSLYIGAIVAVLAGIVILGGGKRIRALLVLNFNRILGGAANDAMEFAAAIEMMHVFIFLQQSLSFSCIFRLCPSSLSASSAKPSAQNPFSAVFLVRQ